MKKLLAAVAVAVLVPAAPPASAQLLRPNAGGLTMGVIVLNVSDVAAHEKFWVEEFDAKLLKVGQLRGATVPGFVILFRPQAATGPSEGSTINHMGMKLKKLSDYTARFDRGGYKYDRPRIGRETTPQTYVTGPDGFRIELVEDPTLPVPVIGHHLHYWMAEPEAVKKWYVETLHLAPTYRGPYPAGDVPGMNYTFAPLGSQKGPGVPTKGRVLDQVGLDVTDLKTYCAMLQAAGVKFDVPYGKDAELGLFSATITDPWGASIRLTEGLNKLAGTATFSYTDPYLSTTPR